MTREAPDNRAERQRHSPETCLVIDFIYVLASVVFFAIMLAYVAGCDWLGRKADVERATKERS